ncbi:hypothetical protein, partial [Gilliamella sp. Pas-s95]|uniref:hypothetical protein n=1 Tax=Gilliamella sp. Pas-s95 TaxID=2687317 RepID=UPI001F3115D1
VDLNNPTFGGQFIRFNSLTRTWSLWLFCLPKVKTSETTVPNSFYPPTQKGLIFRSRIGQERY